MLPIGNPNWIVPTPPAGDSSNRVANTEFVADRTPFYTPEMFGATPSTNGTPAASLTSCLPAIASAIAALTAIGGGTLQFGPGAYAVEDGFSILADNIYLKGAGLNATWLVMRPTTPGSAITVGKSGGIVSNCGVSDLSVGATNTTTLKVAISNLDTSQCTYENILVSTYPQGSGNFKGGAPGSVGLSLQGRELGLVRNCQFNCERPLLISGNFNAPGTAEDLDSWTFSDLTLIGELSTATFHCITVASGVSIFNTRFTGHQNWIGGVDGFHWIDVGAVASFGLYIEGIKDEQAGTSGGYSVNIDPVSIYGVHISDALIGTRNAIRLRNVINADLENITYNPSVSSTKIGLNISTSCRMVSLQACAWITGTLLTNSPAMTLQAGSFLITGMATTIPASGTYLT
jgi:hypothetical protein